MAGKLRYWKEKDGRFWARMAVPGPVKEIIGRSEIIEPLGGDRREAIKKHPAAVARLRTQIAEAEAALRGQPAPAPSRDPITTADFGRAVWQRYTTAIEADEAARASYASAEEVAAAMNALEDRVGSGELSEPYAEPAVTLPAGYASAYGETSDEEKKQVAELVAGLGGPKVGAPQSATEDPTTRSSLWSRLRWTICDCKTRGRSTATPARHVSQPSSASWSRERRTKSSTKSTPTSTG